MSQWGKRAVVIVHGIGVQSRDSTRDVLVRALGLQATVEGPVAEESVGFSAPLPPIPIRVVKGDLKADVYEVYWAPLTSHQTTARSVLSWGLATTFLPGDKKRVPSRKTVLDALQALVWVALAVTFVLGVVSSLARLTSNASACVQPGGSVSCPRGYGLESKPSGESTVGRGITQIGAVGEALWRSRPDAGLGDLPLKELSPTHVGEVLTSITLRTAAFFAPLLWVIGQTLYRAKEIIRGGHRRRQAVILLADLGLFAALAQFVPPVLSAFAVVLVVGYAVLRGARTFIAESLGDVQVYSTTDENSAHYAARQAVLAEAEKVFGLVHERGYSEVVVLGHSLGSVVALDALRAAARRSPEFAARLMTFVTFGAALEKVRYCFSRKAGGEDDYSSWNIEVYKLLSPAAWVNIWYRNDVVANPITTYQIEPETPFDLIWRDDGTSPRELLEKGRQRLVVNIRYPSPLKPWSHSDYLGDERVLAVLEEAALGAPLRG